MVTSFGIALTKLTSKAGILSRKAAVRLSTETGKRLVDKSREVGRLLNKEEVELIFEQMLPKKCRPQIITTKEEVANIFRQQGLPETKIQELINNPYVGAATVTNGKNKCPIWIPFENIENTPALQPYANPLIAHELEHALEKNNRMIDIIRRKTSGIRKYFAQKFDKNFMEKAANREIAIHDYENMIQFKVGSTLDANTRLMRCDATVEGMDTFMKSKRGRGLIDCLRDDMRNSYAGAENQGSEVNKRLKLMKYWLDMEKPAYHVTGEIEKYAGGLKQGENAAYTAVSKGYEAAYDIAKQEKRNYWKNKLLGRLKKPNVYVNDKDLFKYATSKEDKKRLSKLIDDIDLSLQRELDSAKTEDDIIRITGWIEREKRLRKDQLIKLLSLCENNPNSIKNISDFIEKTNVNGRNIYLDNPMRLRRVFDIENLSNPDVIEFAKLSNIYPEYSDLIEEIIMFSSSDSKILKENLNKVQNIIKNDDDIRKSLKDLYDNHIENLRARMNNIKSKIFG